MGSILTPPCKSLSASGEGQIAPLSLLAGKGAGG